MNITIPDGDQFFNAGDQLHFSRSQFSSTGANGERNHFSVISPWIDGGNIYGSDDAKAKSLRSEIDGKMKTSPGNLLPKIDDTFYDMGDVRGNENAILTSLHTIWVRYHNKICDDLLDNNAVKEEIDALNTPGKPI